MHVGRARFWILSALAVCWARSVEAFVSPDGSRQSRACKSSALSVTTLTDETTWRLRFSLNGVPTEQGKKVDELFVVEAQFLEEEGYEPPQGTLHPVDKATDGVDDNSRRLKILNGRWKLSEDPNERKDGLWVWGLFKEPLYPFLLLQLETDKVPIPGEGSDSLKPLKLFAQIIHTRDKETGVMLKGATLNVREMETVKADPFGGATVDIFEEISVGQLNIQPVESKASV